MPHDAEPQVQQRVARVSDLAGHSRADLFERGRAERASVARREHGGWAPAADRRDPLEILAESNAVRVPELVPLRMARMAVSPFTYFRGAPAVMAADLAATPTTSIWPQICGDAHVSNFGLFASPERALVFDVNDFDETLPGPFEWDLKRLAASAVVAARSVGLGNEAGLAAAEAAVRAYARTMADLATRTTLDIWYASVRSEDLEPLALDGRMRKNLNRSLAKARTRTTLQAFEKLTTVVDGRRVIVEDPPLIVRPSSDAEAQGVEYFWSRYRETLRPEIRRFLDQYELVDVARKVVGVGSVGTRCFMALLTGRAELDPLLIQVKESLPSVLEPHLGRSEFSTAGERVVVGQRTMQAASDMLLGWGSGPEGRSFFVRQLRDMKFSADLEGSTAPGLARYAAVCGGTLAQAHARSCDPALISGYVGQGGGTLAGALCSFGQAYADQTERDHAQLVASLT